MFNMIDKNHALLTKFLTCLLTIWFNVSLG